MLITTGLEQKERSGSRRAGAIRRTDAVATPIITIVDHHCLGVHEVIHEGELQLHEPARIPRVPFHGSENIMSSSKFESPTSLLCGHKKF
jgi:hypothetical protein